MNTRKLLAMLLLCGLTVAASGASGQTPHGKRTFAGTGPDQRVDSGARVVMAGNGRSVDGRPIRFSWVQVAGPRVELRNANRSTAHFAAPKINVTTTLKFRLTVTDTLGGKGTNVVTITVEPKKPPTATSKVE